VSRTVGRRIDFSEGFVKDARVLVALDSILKRCVAAPPNILATLQAVQAAFGYVPLEAVPQIAAALGVSDSDVRGVISFYHDLRTEKPGRHIIRFCLGDSCRATQGEKSLLALEKKLGCELGETTKDQRFTLEKVYCLGNCALSPNMMIGEEIYCRLTPDKAGKALGNHR
jgi:NADH:ubiquinone oxidoreductase subunit E